MVPKTPARAMLRETNIPRVAMTSTRSGNLPGAMCVTLEVHRQLQHCLHSVQSAQRPDPWPIDRPCVPTDERKQHLRSRLLVSVGARD